MDACGAWPTTYITDVEGDVLSVMAVDAMLVISHRTDEEEDIFVLAADEAKQLVLVLQRCLHPCQTHDALEEEHQ